MRYEVFDWGGAIPWLMRPDGTFLVDPHYLEQFLDEAMQSMDDNDNGR